MLLYSMNDLKYDLNKMADRLLNLEDTNENLKIQINQLKQFGETQVKLNSKQCQLIKQTSIQNKELKKKLELSVMENNLKKSYCDKQIELNKRQADHIQTLSEENEQLNNYFKDSCHHFQN